MSTQNQGFVLPLFLLCAPALAQTAGPAFEVASIKPATPLGPMGMRADRSGGPGTRDPGMYTCRNCPISWVFSEAYDVQPFEYAAPDWLETARFDFAAKLPAGTSKEVFHLMLQSLLTERFQLQAHREKRPASIYELTVAKSGPKFHESPREEAVKTERPADGPRIDSEGFPILSGETTMAVIPGHARIRSNRQGMAWFARMLSGQLGSTVVDATGLPGKYDFQLSWAYAERSTGPDSGNGEASLLEAFRPALMVAVQSQLGLKLEQKRGEAEILVIDRLEKRPTEN